MVGDIRRLDRTVEVFWEELAGCMDAMSRNASRQFMSVVGLQVGSIPAATGILL